jgi:hypothetical protein
MSKGFKRKRLLVDPAFQFRLIGRVAAYLPLYLVVVFHVAFGIEVMRTVAVQGPTKSLPEMYAEYFHQQLPLVFTALLLTPPLLYDLLKFSHRVAGPLYRCRKVMEEMATGQAAPLFVPRNHDLMGELFASFNKLIVAWNERVGTRDATPLPCKDHAPPIVPSAQAKAPAAV